MIAKFVKDNEEILFETNAPLNYLVKHREDYPFTQDNLFEDLKKDGFQVNIIKPFITLNYDA